MAPRRRPKAPARPPADPALTPELARQIQRDLLAWYRRGHRDLPWRRTSDPYAIWVSEIMLQQTRVDTVRERFTEFMGRFPTVNDLAAAPLGDVLSLWSGLGYYARARNLHAAAREVAERYGGRVPDDPEAVGALPGIGPYTAGAILSIAFGRSAPILDGNVIRVVSRLFALDELPEGAGRKRFWTLSEALLPPVGADRDAGGNDVGDFNQGLMELGATVCLPQRPVCLVCPLAATCQARQEGEPERYPTRKAQRAVPVVRAVTLLVTLPGDGRRPDQVLLVERPPSGLWGGLWEPPTLSLEPDESEEAGLRRLLGDKLGLPSSATGLLQLPPFVHVLTHREMRFAPYALTWPAGEAPPLRLADYAAARWVEPGRPLALGLAAWVSALLARWQPPTGCAALRSPTTASEPC